MRRLPELQEELQILLQKTEDSLRQLPKPPSTDTFAEILHLISEFCRDLDKHLEGTPGENGLLQVMNPLKEKFRAAVRDTAPDFRPYKGPKDGFDGDTPSGDGWSMPSFLSHEEESAVNLDSSHAIYINQVMDRARKLVFTGL